MEEKEYKKELNRLMRQIIVKPKQITENLEKIVKLLEDMEKDGVITKKQKEKHILRIYREMNSPAEFREWLMSRADWIKKKLRMRR